MTTPVTRKHPQRPAPRWWSRFAVLLALTLVTGVGLAGPAAAHNVLIASDPADGSTLQQSPTVITLTFDQAVQDFQPVVTILGADGQRFETGAPAVDSTVVTQSVTTLTVPGPYTIAYRVVSADGHPVQGELRFELAAPPSSSPSSSAPESPASPALSSAAPTDSAGSQTADSSSTAVSSPAAASSALPVVTTVVSTNTSADVAPAGASSGLSGWVWAAIAVAAALVATAIVVIVRRPKPTDQPGQPK